MASTLTDKGELTVEYASFPIEKTETTEDGDLIVYGKASDGGLDSDQQIVDPAWMATAAQTWKSSGANLRVQHNPQRDPAGVGLEVSTDGQGATWVKGLVVEPIAKKLVAKGALTAYSVGIARPTIVRDAHAPGGRITGGELVEISLVDRPANKRCGIQLVKSDHPQDYINEVFGDEADLAKALGGEIIAKGGDGSSTTFGKSVETDTNVQFSLPEDMSFTFTPNDLAKILQNKVIENHYEDLALKAIADAESEITKRDINTATRRQLASRGHALPDGSYPIANTEDLQNAAVLARSGHGNVSGAKSLIERRAKELGVANPLSNPDSQKGESVADATIPQPEAVKEADPDVTKDPVDTEDEQPKTKKAKKPKGGKKMPPWLAGDDADKPADADAEKGLKDTPEAASGAKDAPDMKPAPLPEMKESPAKDFMKAEDDLSENPEIAAMVRFKTLGIDTDMGRLHDLTCPAFSPDQVSKYHPMSDLKNTIDERVFQRKALEAAAGKSLSEAMDMQAVWQAASTLKGTSEALLNSIRLELHKAFRDANPGPTSYPSPGCVSPGKFNRPVISGGHATNSPGYGSPNSSPSVASGPVEGAGSFDRPPLGAGHQSPSPSFMKNDFEVPTGAGTTQRLTYAHMEKEQALAALSRLHSHLGSVVPNICPMDMNSRGPLDPNPAINAVGKADEPEAVKTETETVKGLVEGIAKAPFGDYDDDFIEKAFKKSRKKLGKKVLSGKMTVDEARSRLGRMSTQKNAEEELHKGMESAAIEMVDAGELSIDDARKALGLPTATTKSVDTSAAVEKQIDASLDYIQKTYGPDVIKSAVLEAINPLQEMLAAQREAFEAKLAEQQKVIDAIADSPDPRGEPFSGIALNMNKSARPVAVPDVAETAERTQQMMIRQLDHTWRTSENPAEREAAWTAIRKFRGISE